MSRWRYYLPILGYHRVGSSKGDHVPTVSEESFERQLAFLAREQYRVLSAEELATCIDQGAPWPRRSVAITFDDGYEETYTIAWPRLKRFGFPATVFITPSEVGLQGFATWSQVCEMGQDGMVIGCHTMHHSYLPTVPRERLQEEVVESKRIIEQQVGQPIRFISYPVGGFSSHVQAAIRAAGYGAAFTTNRLSPVRGIDRFALRRIKVTDRDRNPWLFRAKLSGYYDLFRQLKDPS